MAADDSAPQRGREGALLIVVDCPCCGRRHGAPLAQPAGVSNDG